MTVAASIVVVTHHGAGDVLRSCLASVAAADDLPTATIVVDNSGRPASPPTSYGPGVSAVVRVDNRGFGAAANAGIEYALRAAGPEGDAPVVVLNDDIDVDPGWLTPLVDALGADHRLGAVQPALLRHGTDRINSLGVELDRFAAGVDIAVDRPADALGGSTAIEIFTGGAVAFRRRFLEQTGGFDERYFLYYEDVDLALRGAEFGWRYRCETSSLVHHHGGVSTAELGDDRVRYLERNRLWTAFRFAAAPTIWRAVGLSVRKLRHRPRRTHGRALIEGLGGAPGATARRITARRLGGGAIVSANGG